MSLRSFENDNTLLVIRFIYATPCCFFWESWQYSWRWKGAAHQQIKEWSLRLTKRVLYLHTRTTFTAVGRLPRTPHRKGTLKVQSNEKKNLPWNWVIIWPCWWLDDSPWLPPSGLRMTCLRDYQPTTSQTTSTHHMTTRGQQGACRSPRCSIMTEDIDIFTSITTKPKIDTAE
jgi:hypothetical protein